MTEAKPDDLPTIFQLVLAHESNSQHLESLHELFQKQQMEIDYIKETLNVQHEILDMIIEKVQKK